MSWRDVSSSSNRSSTNDGNGGSMSAGGGDSGGGGGNYTFSGVPGSRNIGNFNTGGPAVATGSFSRGINPIGAPPSRFRPAAGPPTRMVKPPVIPPPAYTIPTYPTVPMTRLQNYLTEMETWRKQNPIQDYSSTFPARPGATTRVGTDVSAAYGNDQFGSSLGGRGNTRGNTGGGYGGGGGGGF